MNGGKQSEKPTSEGVALENGPSQKEDGSLAQIRTEVAGSRVPHD